jgi:cobalt transporter subunit CbtB
LGVSHPGLPRLPVELKTTEDRVMPISSAKHSIATPVTLSQRVVIAVGASLLGLCLVYFAGFSHIEAVHNAAHDTRHSAAFPCH